MLSGRPLLVTTAVLYSGVCLIILFAFKPWAGGDGGLSYAIGINLVSFPSGMIASCVLSWVTADSAYWWLYLLVGCGVVGYGQWLLVSRLISRSNSTPHTDARASAVVDQPSSARAGERGR
jgi:hypothetical protein